MGKPKKKKDSIEKMHTQQELEQKLCYKVETINLVSTKSLDGVENSLKGNRDQLALAYGVSNRCHVLSR